MTLAAARYASTARVSSPAPPHRRSRRTSAHASTCLCIRGNTRSLRGIKGSTEATVVWKAKHALSVVSVLGDAPAAKSALPRLYAAFGSSGSIRRACAPTSSESTMQPFSSCECCEPLEPLEPFGRGLQTVPTWNSARLWRLSQPPKSSNWSYFDRP